MRALVQRVKEASVSVNGEIVSSIGQGLLVFLGIKEGDSEKDIDFLSEKIVNLRIFNDDAGKLNLSALDSGAEILIVSQFTLYGDCRKGRRPSYSTAMAPDKAKQVYEQFVTCVEKSGLVVATGEFQAMMEVTLTNDGPVTLMLET